MTYDEFINNIINSRGRFGIANEDYKERHHIQPRCLGGQTVDENLIDLYAHEHFIAHKLLYEQYPDNQKIAYAYWMMAHCKNENEDRYECTPEEYEESKIAFITTVCGEKHPMYGKPRPDEVKEKISKSSKGKIGPNKGRHFSEEHRMHMSESHKGKNHSLETRKKLSELFSGENNPMARQIYCFELNEYFWGSVEVENKYGINAGNVRSCCKGNLKSAGKHPITGEKLHWCYTENLDNMEVVV